MKLSRRFSSSFIPIPINEALPISTFRENFFRKNRPVAFRSVELTAKFPAIQKWFALGNNSSPAAVLNNVYLNRYGTVVVPFELIKMEKGRESQKGDTIFERFDAPLSLLLRWTAEARNEFQRPDQRLYLAQCSLSRLPKELQEDFPTPEPVQSLGRGDVYDANIWIGVGETYTPLHRDPNPNFFLQLAGRKRVRLLEPAAGDRLYAATGREIARHGRYSSGLAKMRGEEMMVGLERAILERKTWNGGDEGDTNESEHGLEVDLGAGEGIFIPLGWWHSMKGYGEGVIASVRNSYASRI
jgi:hypothetical protein